MDNLMECLKEERHYNSFKEALYYAVLVQRENNEDLAIFRTAENEFYTIHSENAEIAIRLGFEPIVGFTEILFVAESEEEPEKALENYYKRVGEKK